MDLLWFLVDHQVELLRNILLSEVEVLVVLERILAEVVELVP
jgi:hypothetical protein